MKMLKKNGGFTLVELIIVIAILAILAGVAVPLYSGYLTKANDAAVISELDALKTAVNAANATEGGVTAITVSADGKTVTLTATKFAANFGADFNTYYGKTATWDAATGKLTFATAITTFASTSYTTGATWSTGTNKWAKN